MGYTEADNHGRSCADLYIKVKEASSPTKYVFEPRAKTWSDAEKDCQERGGNLASIANKEENAEVWGAFKNRPGMKYAWIGINDSAQEGRWMLSNGLGAIKYSNWSRGEPNNLGSEHCAMVYGSSGLWNDSKCGNKYPYVCQAK